MPDFPIWWQWPWRFTKLGEKTFRYRAFGRVVVPTDQETKGVLG